MDFYFFTTQVANNFYVTPNSATSRNVTIYWQVQLE